MHPLQEAEKLISLMSKAEKAQVLQWVIEDATGAFPSIESKPDVCGGVPCLVRTRIPVWVLVQAKNLGMSDVELLKSYPALRAEDLTTARAYYRSHTDEIDQQIYENENA